MKEERARKSDVKFRLDEELVARAERLLVTMQAKHPVLPLSLSDALRAAVVRGLPVLEREYGLATEEPSEPPRKPTSG